MIKDHGKGKNTYRSLFLLFVSVGLLSCTSVQRAFLLHDIARTPAKNLQSYEFDAASTIISRVKPAPDFVMSYLKLMDKADDYSSYTPTQEELRMIDDYLTKLPRHNREVLQKRLIAIYFIHNFRGAGLTDYVLDDKKDMYTIMAFNPDTLKMDLSRWLTYRENSCFVWGPSGEQIEIFAGTEYTGFLYAIVHESAHVVDYVEAYTPYPERNIGIINGKKILMTPFVTNVWKDLETPLQQYDFSARTRVTFYGYGGPQIAVADAARAYEDLARTPFVSLYGSTSWAEDFADLVMFYHLTQKLGQPYEIQYTNNSGEIKALRPMEGEKVKDRFRIIESLYQGE